MTQSTEQPNQSLPCPHGRLPMNGEPGYKHCPHCLGVNEQPKTECYCERCFQIKPFGMATSMDNFEERKIKRLKSNGQWEDSTIKPNIRTALCSYCCKEIYNKKFIHTQIEKAKEDGRAEALGEVMKVINEQAQNEALWYFSETAPEKYLQEELRRLHAIIEFKSKQPDV